jgi:hypothetical protein
MAVCRRRQPDRKGKASEHENSEGHGLIPRVPFTCWGEGDECYYEHGRRLCAQTSPLDGVEGVEER